MTITIYNEPHRRFEPLTKEQVQEVLTGIFADDTMSDEDLAIVAAVEKIVWNKAMDTAADWIKWYDCQSNRREEYIRSLKVD